MSRGFCFIAFGKEYDMLAAYTIAMSKKFIAIPITVLTNIKERHSRWVDSPDVNFIYLDIPTDFNREVKNQIYKYTPYDETLYIDCDAVIVRPGIERIFDFLKGKDIVFQHYTWWLEGRKYYRIYRNAAKKYNILLPWRIYLGGFWAFRKSEQTIKFFDLWNQYWKELGGGRDMPALACAVRNSAIQHEIVNKIEHKFFSFGVNSNTIVRHRRRYDDLLKYYGIPNYKQNKPFDKNDNKDWQCVYFDKRS